MIVDGKGVLTRDMPVYILGKTSIGEIGDAVRDYHCRRE